MFFFLIAMSTSIMHTLDCPFLWSISILLTLIHYILSLNLYVSLYQYFYVLCSHCAFYFLSCFFFIYSLFMNFSSFLFILSELISHSTAVLSSDSTSNLTIILVSGCLPLVLLHKSDCFILNKNMLEIHVIMFLLLLKPFLKWDFIIFWIVLLIFLNILPKTTSVELWVFLFWHLCWTELIFLY